MAAKAKRGKTGKKTGKMRSPRNGAEVLTGAHPGNTGGKKGRSGRRPLVVKELAKQILERDQLLELAAGIARNTDQRAGDRLAAIRLLLEYAEGKPQQPVDVTSGGRPLLLAGAI